MAQARHPKTETLIARISPEIKLKLAELAARLDLTSSDVVRELVTGFCEGRVTISPPPDKKESLYNARNQD